MKYSATMFAVLAGLVALPGTALPLEPYLPGSPNAFKRVDANHDGKVELGEIQQLAEKRFMKLDANKSGDVTAAEIDAALMKALELRRNRTMKNMDKDSSGSISKAELDQAVAAIMKSADADSDGSVTLAEVRSFRIAKTRKPATGEGAN